MLPLVLASASPRRRALLAAAGVEFTVAPVDIDESLEPGCDPVLGAERLALEKAEAGARQWIARAGDSRAQPRGACILGADTVVGVPRPAGWELLGKPVDARDAERMLGLLSDTRHLVVTAVAIVRTTDGARGVERERTWVRMRAITPAERAAYVASREWEGKAGGYAIQESADRFVTGLEEGGFDNVVGLPVARALRLYESLARAVERGGGGARSP